MLVDVSKLIQQLKRRAEEEEERRGEEGMSLLDVELGPRSAEDRGLVFSGTARTTLWFQCKYCRSAFRFPSTEPAVWSSPSSFSPVLGMFCVSFALLRLCDMLFATKTKLTQLR